MGCKPLSEWELPPPPGPHAKAADAYETVGPPTRGGGFFGGGVAGAEPPPNLDAGEWEQLPVILGC